MQSAFALRSPHRELGYRTPYCRGLACCNKLGVKGVPSRLVFFPDEHHWIQKPQNSVLWYREFLDWCGTWAA